MEAKHILSTKLTVVIAVMSLCLVFLSHNLHGSNPSFISGQTQTTWRFMAPDLVTLAATLFAPLYASKKDQPKQSDYWAPVFSHILFDPKIELIPTVHKLFYSLRTHSDHHMIAFDSRERTNNKTQSLPWWVYLTWVILVLIIFILYLMTRIAP